MTITCTTDLPSPSERPATSDDLPTGRWLKELQEDGYRPFTWSTRATWLPLALGAAVVLATVLVAWIVWDRIPDQIPMHTGADGQVTRWGEKNVGNVLAGPLIGGGGLLVAMVIMYGVMSVSRPRPSTEAVPGAESLGTMVRQAATMSLMVCNAGWILLSFLLIVCALEVPRWLSGYDAAAPVWLFGVAVLGLVISPVILRRRVRPMIERELSALDVPVGPATERELRAWRHVTVVDDPGAPVWVPFGIPRTNYTVNIAKPAGRILVAGFVGLLLAIALFLLLTPLIFG